jgi:hypothetical protein
VLAVARADARGGAADFTESAAAFAYHVHAPLPGATLGGSSPADRTQGRPFQEAPAFPAMTASTFSIRSPIQRSTGTAMLLPMAR